MPMRIDDKKVAVEELKDIANKATSAVAADYHGASVTELTKLRKDARDTSVHLKVIRNTLAKKALTDTKFSCFEDLLCLLYTSPSPRDATLSRMPSSA